MLYMTTSDDRFTFDFAYATPDDELHNQLSLQTLEARGRGSGGRWTRSAPTRCCSRSERAVCSGLGRPISEMREKVAGRAIGESGV